jgi:hypothetical protein
VDVGARIILMGVFSYTALRWAHNQMRRRPLSAASQKHHGDRAARKPYNPKDLIMGNQNQHDGNPQRDGQRQGDPPQQPQQDKPPHDPVNPADDPRARDRNRGGQGPR